VRNGTTKDQALPENSLHFYRGDTRPRVSARDLSRNYIKRLFGHALVAQEGSRRSTGSQARSTKAGPKSILVNASSCIE